MAYFDIALFEVNGELSKRLGYRKIYCSGKDFEISKRLGSTGLPQIVINKDPGTLIGAVRNGGVAGIIFEENELSKKVVEKAEETKKTIFIPIRQLMGVPTRTRGSRVNGIRKIISAARRIDARVRLISLADSGNMLLSAAQMAEMANLLFDGRSDALFGGDIL